MDAVEGHQNRLTHTFLYAKGAQRMEVGRRHIGRGALGYMAPARRTGVRRANKLAEFYSGRMA